MATNKIMFFDIDGTILSETTHTIPKSTVEGLQKAKEQGHLIFINTGRPFSSIDECIKELDPDGYVCGCGTYIRYHDEVLFSKTLSQERCFEVRDLIRKTNVEGVLEGKNTVYFDQNIRHPFLKGVKERYEATPTFNLSTFDDPNLSFDKLAVWFDEHGDIETFKFQFLLDYFGLDKDDAYVFGDSFNDEAMLRYVKHAIVMGNGEPELFKLAYYVTKDIEEDGIYHALQHLNLI